MFGFFTGRRNTTYSPAEQAPGFPTPPPTTDFFGSPVTPKQIERARVRDAFMADTAEARKEAWLRAQRPRLKKGSSGEWWCSSHHPGPDRTRPTQFMRVGHGPTPRAAYDSWKAY